MAGVTAAVLLVAVLAVAGWFLRRRPLPPDRRARYRRWIGHAVAAFALPVVLSLVLLGRIDALWRLPGEFAGVAGWLPAMAPGDVVWGAIGGVSIGSLFAAWRAWRGGRPFAKIGALMPRDRGELGWGAAVALVAGATEEPFFRLLLPLLVTLAGGSALVGFAASALLFGAMHRYQGWRGVVATTLFGGVMSAIYLVSGALWVAVVLHALIDLNALLLWPAVTFARRR
jgi:membrane protease YdiL (CAAX protease family)